MLYHYKVSGCYSSFLLEMPLGYFLGFFSLIIPEKPMEIPLKIFLETLPGFFFRKCLHEFFSSFLRICFGENFGNRGGNTFWNCSRSAFASKGISP